MTARTFFYREALGCCVMLWLFSLAMPAAAQGAAGPDVYSIVQLTPGTVDLAAYKRTQTVMVRTPRVLSAALQQTEVASLPIVKKQADPAAWLSNELLVDFPGDTDLMRIGLKGTDKKGLSTIVNAVTQAWLSAVIDYERGERAERRQKLEMLSMQSREDLRRQIDRLYALEQSLGVGDLIASRLASELVQLQHQQSELQRALLHAEVKLARENIRLQYAPDAAPDRRTVQTEIKMTEAEKSVISGKLDTCRQNIELCFRNMARRSPELEMQRIEIEQLKAKAQRLSGDFDQASVGIDGPLTARLIERAAAE